MLRGPLALAAALSLAGLLRAGPPAPTSLAGLWSGDARLFNQALRARLGPIPTALQIGGDLAISGRIGDAPVPKTMPVSVSATRVEYRVVLPQPINTLPGLKRSHLVILVTHHGTGQLDADFHLKSWFGLDPGMLVGHFDLKRTAP